LTGFLFVGIALDNPVVVAVEWRRNDLLRSLCGANINCLGREAHLVNLPLENDLAELRLFVVVLRPVVFINLKIRKISIIEYKKTKENGSPPRR